MALLGQVPYQPPLPHEHPRWESQARGGHSSGQGRKRGRGPRSVFEEWWGAAQPGLGAGTVVSTAPEGRAKTKRGLITVIRAAID